MDLFFCDFDLETVKKYCNQNGNQPYKTEVKRQSLEKLANWFYFYKILQEDPEYKKYITENLCKYAEKSLEYSVLFLMITDPDSEDEKKAYGVVYGKLENMKKNSIAETIRKISEVVSYCGKTFKAPPEKKEEKKKK